MNDQVYKMIYTALTFVSWVHAHVVQEEYEVPKVQGELH
jgi:hypothetical protein